jgi:hypothetical protein
MYVDLGLPQPVGTRTRLRLPLPDGRDELDVTCVVVRGGEPSDPFGVHLVFVDLKPEERRRLRRFVTRERIEDALRA